MEVHHTQRFPSSETGRGLRRRKANEAAVVTAGTMMEVKTERNRAESGEVSAPTSPSINLVLQIGTNSVGSRNERSRTSFVHRQGEFVLTAGQFQELQQQVLIHKHLAAGMRVPTHLLVPIWQSVARTLVSNGIGINDRYHNFIGYSPVGFDYRSMMDPELGRCRRTDGKKWRCSRNTVPDKKYCERHMNRGRQRSRKLVEASKNDAPSKKISRNNNPDRDLRCTVDNSKTKNHFSRHFPASLSFPPIEAVVPSPEAIRMIPASAPNTTATCITAVPSMNPAAITSIPTGYIIDLKDVYNMNFRGSCCKCHNVFRRNDINVQKIPSTCLGFSPNSVLQVPGCSSSLCDSKINIEIEPGRCRRTDGKKWRCRRDVIPNQKYCGLHIHRGSKRQLKPSQSHLVLAPAATYSTTPLPLVTASFTKPERATPNTNLSMSIQAGDEVERSNASSSSETTITA